MGLVFIALFLLVVVGLGWRAKTLASVVQQCFVLALIIAAVAFGIAKFLNLPGQSSLAWDFFVVFGSIGLLVCAIAYGIKKAIVREH
jgi:hypothetical protein